MEAAGGHGKEETYVRHSRGRRTKREVQSIEKEKSEINEMLGCVLLYRADWVSLV